MTYVMERAWPFAIDAVPLQFGSASITKVTAQFYYSKHRVVYHDPTNFPREILPSTLPFNDIQNNIQIA